MNRSILRYSISTALEKNLELGLVLLAYRQGHDIIEAVAAGVAFQFSKIAANRVQITAPTWFWNVLVLIGSCLCSFSSVGIGWFGGAALLTFSVARTREIGKLPFGHGLLFKRYLRPLAVGLTPWFNPWITAIAFVSASIFVTERGLVPFRIKSNWLPRGALQANQLAMMLHHVHFFAYAYAVPIFLVSVAPNGLPFAGVHFYLGYLGYDLWYKGTRSNSWTTFLLGHVVAAGSILLMFETSTWWGFTILWIITGVGAGTVSILPTLSSPIDPDPESNLAIYEDYGHVLGIALAVVLLSLGTLGNLGNWVAAICIGTGVAPYIFFWITSSRESRTT